MFHISYNTSLQSKNVPINQGTSKVHELMNVLIARDENSTDVNEMNATDEAVLRQIAADNAPIVGVDNAAVQAQGVLDRVVGEGYSRWFYPKERTPRATAMPRPSVADDPTAETAEKAQVKMAIAPNPTQHSAIISIRSSLPLANLSAEGSTPYEVSIYDMKGALVKQGMLQGEDDTVELQKSEAGGGIFFSILRKGDEILDRQKMIILE